MTTTYVLGLRASGRTFDDDLIVAFYDEFDGTIALRYGALVLHLVIDGQRRDAACRALIERLESGLGILVEGVDHDLVNVADIARRVSRTRQAVQLWVTGKRGSGGFPVPVGAPGGSRVWHWADVDTWLRANGLPSDPERPLPRTEATVLDGWLAARACRRDLVAAEDRLFSDSGATDSDSDLLADAMDGAGVVAGVVTMQGQVASFTGAF